MTFRRELVLIALIVGALFTFASADRADQRAEAPTPVSQSTQ